MATTTTDITERTAATSPDYTAGAITAPDYTEASALANPFAGTGTDTGTGTVTETDTTGPVISGIRGITISDVWASFDWDTDEPGTCYAGCTTDALGAIFTQYTAHTHYVIGERNVMVTSLKADTVYYVAIRSTDIYANGSADRSKKFKTALTGGVGGTPVIDV